VHTVECGHLHRAPPGTAARNRWGPERTDCWLFETRSQTDEEFYKKNGDQGAE